MVTTTCLKANSQNNQNIYNIFYKHQISSYFFPVKDILYYLKVKFIEKKYTLINNCKITKTEGNPTKYQIL